MKKALVYFLGVASLYFMISIALDHLYAYVFRQDVVRNKRQELLHHRNDSYDVVFLGSSRTEAHVDEKKFEQITGATALNAGVKGLTLHDSYIALHTLVKNDNHFEECWVQLDYMLNKKSFSPSMFAETVPFLNDEVVYNYAMETDQLSAFTLPFQLYMQNDKILGFREFSLKLIGKGSRTDSKLEYKPRVGTGTKLKGNWPEKMEPNKALDKIMELGKREQIKIVLYTSPSCPLEENRDTFLESLEERYSFINYYALFDNQLDYFHDCGHLNDDGAQEFTRVLATEYLKN